MSIIAWKCFRCDLMFQNKLNAITHDDITKHTVREIKLIDAQWYNFRNTRKMI